MTPVQEDRDRTTRAAEQAARRALDLVPVDPRRATAEAMRALSLARRERDPAARSTAYRALGLAAHALHDLDDALRALHSAVRVAESAGLASHAAQARMSRAFILQARGRIRAAMDDADAAVAGMQGLDRARALAQQAMILQRAGEFDRALGLYGEALPWLRRHRDQLWEARLRNNRAILHAFQGHLGRARADITQTADLWASLKMTRALATNKANLGAIEGMHGNIPAALATIDRAAEEFRKGGWPMAAVLMEKGEILLSAGLATEALTVVSTAVTELSRARHAADLAEARLLLARVQLAAGLPGPAIESAVAARRGFTRQQRPGWAAVARYVEAHAAWAAGERSPALLRSTRKAAAELDAVNWSTAALDPRLLAAQIATALGRLDVAQAELQAAARARNSAQLEQRARAWHALALLRVQAADRRGAYAAVSAGLTAAERVRLLLGATELRVMVASHVADLAALGVRLALDDGAADRLLWSAERYRAATLRMRPVLPPADERLAALRAQLRAIAGEAERAQLAGQPLHAFNRRLHALEEELRQRLRHHHGGGDGLEPGSGPVPGGSAAGLARALSAALAGVNAPTAPAQAAPAAAAPTRPVPSAAAPAGPVPAGPAPARAASRVLVEYIESGGRLHAVVVTPSGPPESGLPGHGAGRAGRRRPTLHDLGPVGPLLEHLDPLRFAWRRVLSGHGTPSSLSAAHQLATHAAQQLDQALLAPLAARIAGRPLVIVPAGLLQSLPWPMLPTCAGRPVTVAPSAATWLAARPAPSPDDGAARRVVLIAGPGLSQEISEVSSLAALYPGAQVLTGASATVAAALQALDGADIAHIAAHGRFRADNPMFSSIVLADGPLTVYDMERLRRAPKTIMLAACDTALASAHPGDEMTGLAAALLAVGASSVVAPLLPLPDDIAARLAHDWHRGLGQGLSPAEALSGAVASQALDEPVTRLAGDAIICIGHGG